MEIRTWVGRHDSARIEDALCLVTRLFSKLANRGRFWRLAVIDEPCGKFWCRVVIRFRQRSREDNPPYRGRKTKRRQNKGKKRKRTRDLGVRLTLTWLTYDELPDRRTVLFDYHGRDGKRPRFGADES